MPPSPSKPKTDYRRDTETFGRRGELLAAWFLRLKGYRILESRYRTPVGEIDLIARRFNTIAFVEVKSRNRPGLEREALLAVNDQRITRAAQYYITRHPEALQGDLRFDVIFLAPRSWPRHVINAFPAS